MTMRIECDFRHGLVDSTITHGPDGPVLSLTHGQACLIIALSEHGLSALCLALVASIAHD